MRGSSASACILLSRQALHPSGRDRWVRAVIAAVDWVRKQNLLLNTSVGNQTWELQLTYALNVGVLPRVWLPVTSSEEFHQASRLAARQFDIDESIQSFAPVCIRPDEASPVNRMASRDKAVILNSDTIVPVSISPTGNMSRLLSEARTAGKNIVDHFRCPYSRRTATLSYRVDPEGLVSGLGETDGKYITHWTRAAGGPWPDESRRSFYASVMDSNEYPRSALATLARIVDSCLLIASPNHMPQSTRCVCFSDLSPRRLLPLIRWRRRYRQMSFEPYGLGIEKATALKLGLRPVRYTASGKAATSETAPVWLCQAKGRLGDWTLEREWRYRGNLDLSGVDRNKLIIFTRFRNEAEQMEAVYSIRSLSFEV